MTDKEQLPRNIKLPNPWAPPLVSSPFPACDLCSWSYSDREKIWTLKFRNSQCWRHKPEMMPQEAPETLLSLLQAG